MVRVQRYYGTEIAELAADYPENLTTPTRVLLVHEDLPGGFGFGQVLKANATRISFKNEEDAAVYNLRTGLVEEGTVVWTT